LRVGLGSAKKGCSNEMFNIVPALEQAIRVN